MAGLTPQQMAQRYLQGVQGGAARQRYLDGVSAVTESPMAKAAAADDLYLQRVTESVNSGRRKQKLLAAPLSRWKDNASKKGAERYASGAAAAMDKVNAHFQKFGPIYDQVSKEVASMPKGTIEDSIARVAHVMRRLKEAAGKSA